MEYRLKGTVSLGRIESRNIKRSYSKYHEIEPGGHLKTTVVAHFSDGFQISTGLNSALG